MYFFYRCVHAHDVFASMLTLLNVDFESSDNTRANATIQTNHDTPLAPRPAPPTVQS